MDKLEKSQMCSMLGSLSLPYRQGPVPFPPVHLSLGNWIPAEVELPVKPPISHVRPSHVFKCVIADHIDDWAHNSFPVRKQNGFKTKLFFFWISHGFTLRLLRTKANSPWFQLLFHKWGCANCTFSVVSSFLGMLIPAVLPKAETCPLLTLPGASCSSAKSSPHGRSDCHTPHPCSTNHSVLANSPPYFLLTCNSSPHVPLLFSNTGTGEINTGMFLLGAAGLEQGWFYHTHVPMPHGAHAAHLWYMRTKPTSCGCRHARAGKRKDKQISETMGGHRDKK